MVNEAAAMPNIVHHIFFSLSIPLLSHNVTRIALCALPMLKIMANFIMDDPSSFASWEDIEDIDVISDMLHDDVALA